MAVYPAANNLCAQQRLEPGGVKRGGLADTTMRIERSEQRAERNRRDSHAARRPTSSVVVGGCCSRRATVV